MREWRLADGEGPGALGASAELRHELEYEPEDRPLFWLSYPTTGGQYRTPEFGAGMELENRRVLPESFRLNRLADLWERSFPTQNAYEKGGITHPKESFSLYLIGNAMVEMNRVYPESSWTRVGMPILIVLADGWDHIGNGRDRVESYQRIKAELLDTVTVGELKQKYSMWRGRFYDFGANKKRWTSWILTQQLLFRMESTWAGYEGQRFVAVRAPEVLV